MRFRPKGRRLAILNSVVFALGLHAVALLCLLGWGTPPMITAPMTEQISLMAWPGRAYVQATKPSNKPSAPSVRKASSAPTAIVEAVLGLTLALKPRPDLPKELEPILADLTLGGGSPASTPALTTPAASTDAPVADRTATGGGKTCQILDILQAALQASEPVRKGLALIPPGARSVANAVMLWDGRWVDQARLGGPAAIGVVQSAVLQSVSGAPAACQAEIVRGPRLITIMDANNTIVLAFGSGEWRWADLLIAAPQPQFVN